MKQPSNKKRAHERGVVIIWIAFFMLFMLGFTALGIDVAKLMATRTQLQNAADGAALAGAAAIDPMTGKIVEATAIAQAQTTAGLNKAFVKGPTSVELAAADVTFPTSKQCRVVVRREAGLGGEMITHVAQVLGINSLSVTATATAQVDLASGVCEHLVPMGAVPPNGQPDYFKTGCSNSYALKVGPQAGSQGNFQALDYPGCSETEACKGMPETGANTYRCLLSNGYSCCVDVGQKLWTEPGNMSGPTSLGLQARWDLDTDRTSNICYKDYKGNGQRVVVVPIISAIANGRTQVTVLAFAAFFMNKRPTGTEVNGEFLSLVAPGKGGGTTGTMYTVRLVQ